MANDNVLSQLIDEAGFSGSKILTQANDPKVKTELRERTKEAKDTGINGVPSYRVFRRRVGESSWKQDGDIVWGQDLVADVEDYIAGWDGTTIAKVGSNETAAVTSRL
jgi:2-hydroxychromene-2-carboxylate isomerase